MPKKHEDSDYEDDLDEELLEVAGHKTARKRGRQAPSSSDEEYVDSEDEAPRGGRRSAMPPKKRAAPAPEEVSDPVYGFIADFCGFQCGLWRPWCNLWANCKHYGANRFPNARWRRSQSMKMAMGRT